MKETEIGLTAVVTGASSGIGKAIAQQLTALGWNVLAVARRIDRLQKLAEESGCATMSVDITSDESVAELASEVERRFGAKLNALVNVAGGAFGVDPVEHADLDRYRKMYDVNVLGSVRVTKALLPALRASGRGDILMLTSTAALAAYEGGGGYNAAKAAEQMITRALRLELAGSPIRVIEVRPGLVKTEEFSLVRLGDARAAQQVYEGVQYPLLAEDVADVCCYALNLPHHINLDEITVRPIAQAANHKLVRGSGL